MENNMTAPLNAAFWRWFGDSKVVDANGDPLVVYHGTTKNFTVFKRGRKAVGGAIYFGDLAEARAYSRGIRGARIIAAHLSIQKLWDHERLADRQVFAQYLLQNSDNSDQDIEDWLIALRKGNYDAIESPEFQAFLRKYGYDGFTLNQYGGAKNYAVYDPVQIKSVNNVGTWSPDDPDIMRNPEIPPKLGTIWPYGAKIQVIGDDNRWKTIATCMDTPKAISDALKSVLAMKEYSKGELWIRNSLGERIMWLNLMKGYPMHNPRALVPPTKQTRGEGAYLYHGTAEENLLDILESGLLPFPPWHGTDQNTWPDGGRGRRIYFSERAESVWQFTPEGRPVILRVAKSDVPGARHEISDDWYATKRVSPEKIEVLTEDGWMPLSSIEEL